MGVSTCVNVGPVLRVCVLRVNAEMQRRAKNLVLNQGNELVNGVASYHCTNRSREKNWVG